MDGVCSCLAQLADGGSTHGELRNRTDVCPVAARENGSQNQVMIDRDVACRWDGEKQRVADWNGVDRFDSEECPVRRSAIVFPLPWTTGLLAYWTYGTPPLINRLYPFRPDPCWANAEPQLSEPKALPVELTSTQSVRQPTP